MCSSEEDFDENTWKKYNQMRDAFQGIYDVFNITLNPKSFYYQCGIENLIGLRESLIYLLKNDFDILELQKILSSIELYPKKSSILGDPEEKKQNKENKSTT
ncbi:MAG: hypothetical protein ACFE8N_09650 [Promethearchaeota archaeon]